MKIARKKAGFSNLICLILIPVVFVFITAQDSFGACPVNMVGVGSLCVDKYEASVWSKPPKNNGAPQGTQFGLTLGVNDYPCSENGNDCSASASHPIYAASFPGIKPSTSITWFQAQQACANVGKRLLRNGEWQMAAAGTPDPGTDNGTTDCNTLSDAGFEPEPTGSRVTCQSNWGVNDMVGNVDEWVEDWIQDNEDLDDWIRSTSLFGDDAIWGIDEAFGETKAFPAAIIRGGSATISPSDSGVFALNARFAPSSFGDFIGFRCAN